MRSDADLTEADWKACQKGIIQLALKYPGSLLRERLGVFNNTIVQRQVNSNQKLVFASTVLVYTDPPETMRDAQKDFLYHSIASWPLNVQLREDFIMSLSYREDVLGGLLLPTWWMLPAFVLLLAAVAVLGVRRRWMQFFAAGALAARIPLVFLTAPDTYFMYYLTPYIAGYAITAAGVVYAVMRHKKQKEERRGRA